MAKDRRQAHLSIVKSDSVRRLLKANLSPGGGPAPCEKARELQDLAV